jgi:hypothetical protein
VLEGLDRSGVLAWIGRRVKPLPTFGTGAFAGRPDRLPFTRSVGALFPQPEVRTPDGETLRLDDLIGPNWAALAANGEATAALAATGVPVLELGRDVTDPSGGISDWLRGHDADWALLRPDRFVFACGDAEAAAEAAVALRRTVGNGLRTAAVSELAEMAA